MPERAPRCRGLMGLIFGHRFNVYEGESIPHCDRCGIRGECDG